MPQSRMDSATRVMRARTPDSRSGGADLAVEVFGGKRCWLAVMDQSAVDFDGLLLKDGAAFVVLDDGVAQLPGDLVEGGDAWAV